MPGLEHAVSAMTKRTDADPYYCKDKPRTREPYEVQDGWTDDGRRNMVLIEDFGSVECRYEQGQTDGRCSTGTVCIHAESGAINDAMVRSKGR